MSVPYSANASHSTSNATTFVKHKKPKYSRESLLRRLQVLNGLPAPLPPDLGPSRPSLPPLKRKSEAGPSSDNLKRSRSTPRPDENSSLSTLPSKPPRSEPSEDREPREDPSASAAQKAASTSRWLSVPPSMTPAPHFVPVRRPKRGKQPVSYFDEIHDKYHNWGRMLKYSGDARFLSTYPPNHKEHRPLANPPPPNSPYHKFGGLIARLEILEALVCFAYSIWSKDFGHRSCNRETWTTIEAFLFWCKAKWSADDVIGEREKVFHGLILMIEAYVNARKLYYATRQYFEANVDSMVAQCREEIAAAMSVGEKDKAQSASTPNSTSKNPQMLPSPTSLVPAHSANSTPTSRANGTPNSGGVGASPAPITSRQMSPGNLGKLAHPTLPVPLFFFPTDPSGPPRVPEPGTASFSAVSKVHTVIQPLTLWKLHNLVSNISAAAYCTDRSAVTLTLPLLARHFPVTFARMMYSTLQATDEHEPDMEDCEGELFWPCGGGGEGLGWVCLMGKSMINEFGGEIGYKGLEGIVPKPKPEEGATPGQQGSPPQGSVSSVQGPLVPVHPPR